MPKQRIISLTGPSGVGKSTVAKELLRKNPKWRFVRSVTTRAPRETDLAGEYEYISVDEFKRLLRENKFMEFTKAHGNYYGHLYKTIFEVMNTENSVSVTILTPDKVEEVRQFTLGLMLPVFVYVGIENNHLLASRLKKRGDSDEQVARRLKDCELWHLDALATNIPYFFVENSGPIEENIEKIQQKIGQ